jgi:hypothetical protein
MLSVYKDDLRCTFGIPFPYSADRKMDRFCTAPKKKTVHNLNENHSKSSGRVTSPVNFALAIPIFRCPLTSEILTALKNRGVIISGNLAFCLLFTSRYE